MRRGVRASSACLALRLLSLRPLAVSAELAGQRQDAGVPGRRSGACAGGRESLLLQVGLGKLSGAAQATAGSAGPAGPAGPAGAAGGTTCHTTVEGEPCYGHVRWSIDVGVLRNPGWYYGLSSTSSFEAFQALLHQRQDFDCPLPCDRSPLELESVLQQGALLPPNGKLRFYTVGSSNVVWETWPDQLHAMLKRLGYHVGGETDELKVAALTQPRNVPICDDAATYSHLSTPRVGRVGWSSWGFAYESKDDCGEEGFRRIAGHNVSCANAWACSRAGQTPETLVRPSEVAEEARSSTFVLVSNWINDSRQHFAENRCYEGENIDSVATTDITVDNLRRLIRAIHARNPGVTVLVMARYPGAAGVTVNTGDLPRINSINAAVERRILATETNTIFVNYAFPPGEEVFQTKNFGHPNCRGDKVMATAVLEALFHHKIISKGLALGDSELCLGSEDCASLSMSCCQRSALCHVDADFSCVPYGPGRQ